jgi:HPt (histidine-containing phosphotransfer) domain-containing protein
MSNLNTDIDLSLLYEIADGNNEFIIESIDMFMQGTPELLRAIDTAISGNDWVTVSSSAHKLKSNLGYFGMPVCHAVIQEVELMAKGGGPDQASLSAKFDDVKVRISANLIALEKTKQELAAEL